MFSVEDLYDLDKTTNEDDTHTWLSRSLKFKYFKSYLKSISPKNDCER